MSPFKVIWAILLGLVEVMVALFVAGSSYSAFEGVLIGCVIVIYATLKTIGSGIAYMYIEQLIPTATFRMKMLKYIKEPGAEDEELWKEELMIASEKLSHLTTKFYISMVFNGLVYAIGLLKIFTNI